MKVARFLALVATRDCPVEWLGRIAGQHEQHSALDMVVRGRRLIVFADRDGPLLKTADRSCVLIGTLFRRDEAAAVIALSPAELARAHETRGKSLFDDFWGNYVALLEDPDTGDVHTLRDPMSGALCYHAQRDDIVAVASEPQLLVDCGFAQGGVDWTGLAGHLLAEQLQTERTALTGVSELLAGARMTIGRGPLREMLWSPWTHADRRRRPRDETMAICELRRVALHSTAAWASCFERIVLNLSGGLDSSIVAAGLAGTAADFKCLTLVTADPSGDERDYANMVARHLHAPLHEHLLEVGDVYLSRSAAARFARPVARAFSQAGDSAGMALTAPHGPYAFFNGGGGDSVFCFLQSAAPLADRLLIEGVGRGAMRTLEDISTLAQASLWAVGRSALRKLMTSRRGHEWKPDIRFLAPDLHCLADSVCSHPWLDAPRGALPGKAAHIALLLRTQNHLQTERGLTLPVISPLLSQPLAELCLGIPSWMWCAGGENRHVARAAFAETLPPALVHRRSKGTPDSFVAALFEANRDWIAGTLLDGLLAGAGLLDRQAVARSVNDNVVVRGHDFWRLMRLVDAEIWARSWDARA